MISFYAYIILSIYKEHVKKAKTTDKTLRYTTCMSRTKIGLFGGTFDPPHIGHLILASEAVHQFDLSRLLWMLAPDPPHKQEQPITSLPHRLEMLQRMIAGNPAFEISRLEIDRPGPHYTIDTVRLLAQQEPNADIILLLGGDSLRGLPTWRLCADLVAEVSKIGVMRRPGDLFDMPALETIIPGLKEKVAFIDAPLQDLASREIRRRISAGEPYRYYVFPPVYEYIELNHLYREK
jgi:nicotinate-nucleotide adenylyltransferase